MGGYASEAELVAALKVGDDQAFEWLVHHHVGRLLQVARRYLSEDDARDAVQETFFKAFLAIDRFEERSCIGTWLHRIVVNVSLMRIRRTSQDEELIQAQLPSFDETGKRVDVQPPWQSSAMDFSQRTEARDILRRALKKIPDEYRAVLILRDVEGADTAEAAEALGITPNAVRVRLHRARQALRQKLDVYMRETES